MLTATRFDSAPAALALLVVVLVGRGNAQEYPPPPSDLEILRAAESTLVSMIEETEPSVVGVFRYRPGRSGAVPNRGPREISPAPAVSPDDPGFVPSEFGSGLIFQPSHDARDRLILTAYHVAVDRAEGSPAEEPLDSRLYVRFQGGKGCHAVVVAADPRSDMAVLRPLLEEADLSPEKLSAVRLGQADRLRKGQLVVTIASPYALGSDGSASASLGIIANLGRSPSLPAPHLPREEQARLSTIHHFGTLLQVDARLPLGTSGGAVVDLNREVIAMTVALSALEGYEMPAGYAIPLDAAARRIMDDLAQGYEVEYGLLGVTMTGAGAVERESVPERFRASARVDKVPRNSPADVAGLQEGDRIFAVGGRPIRSDHELIREIGLLAPGTEVALDVYRPALRKSLAVYVILGKWPVLDPEGIIATRSRPGRQWRGITIDYPTGRNKHIDRFDYQDAVLVIGLDRPYEYLHEGAFISRVNGKAVRNPEEFRREVETLQREPVRLQIVDGPEITIPP